VQRRMKTRIAAAATVVALGGLTGLALSAGGQKANTLADKPLVRTRVIHRTVHVTRHQKPKHPAAGGRPGYASSTGGEGAPVVTASSGTSAGEAAPVTTATSGGGGHETAPVTTATSGTGGETAPVTTAASGTGGSGGGEVEHESEGGGDD
jgi:hypothetical protein